MEKRGVVLAFNGVKMVRLHGQISPSGTNSYLKGSENRSLFRGQFGPMYGQNKQNLMAKSTPYPNGKCLSLVQNKKKIALKSEPLRTLRALTEAAFL